MKLFNRIGEKDSATFNHLHNGNAFNVHVSKDSVQIYRNAYFMQLSYGEAIKHLNGMIYEINQIIETLGVK